MILKTLSQSKVPFVALCSYGRSGTTVFMKLLRSIGLTVSGDIPFEDRTIQIAFQRWLQQSMAIEQAGTDFFAGTKYRSFVSETWESWNSDQPFEENVGKWIAHVHSQDSFGVAEKFVGSSLLRMMKSLDDQDIIRPVFLLRDPRDVFISVKEFNDRRGFASFNDKGDDKQLLDIICGFMREQVRIQRRLGGLIVRYEDVVARSRRTVIDTARFCTTASVSSAYVDAVQQRFSESSDAEVSHMTSDSALDSLDRWREPEFAKFEPLFHSVRSAITEIGYAE